MEDGYDGNYYVWTDTVYYGIDTDCFNVCQVSSCNFNVKVKSIILSTEDNIDCRCYSLILTI